MKKEDYQFIYQCRIEGKLCSLPCTAYEAVSRYNKLDCTPYEEFECIILLGDKPNTFIPCEIEKISSYTDEESLCSYLIYEVKPLIEGYESINCTVTEH